MALQTFGTIPPPKDGLPKRVMFGDNPDQPAPREPAASPAAGIDEQLRDREDARRQRLKDEYLVLVKVTADGGVPNSTGLDRIAELRDQLGITRSLDVDVEAVRERMTLENTARAAKAAEEELAGERARVATMRQEVSRLEDQVRELQSQMRGIRHEIHSTENRIQGAEVAATRAARAVSDHLWQHRQLFRSAVDDRLSPEPETIRKSGVHVI